MKKLIIFETGNIVDVMLYYFMKEGKYIVEVFTVNQEYLKEKEYLD